MKLGSFAALVAVAIGLSGCAELTHLTRVRDIAPNAGNGQAILIDAKQRAVVSARVNESSTTYSHWNEQTKRYEEANTTVLPSLRVCAEPSPDALSAIAASQGVSLSQGSKLSGNEASSLAESAGSIGLRTQSIQLMRDEMYHLCEGYLSGALNRAAFETLHHRLQNSMVAILAIEQLTGAVRAQQIVLGGTASTGAADAIQKLTQASADALTALRSSQADLATATDKQKTLKDALDAATKAGGDMPDDAAKKAIADAQKKYDDQTAVVGDDKKKADDKQTAYDAIEAGRKAALSGVTSASAQGTASGGSLDPVSAEHVSTAVTTIVQSTLAMQFSHELCTTVLIGAASGQVSTDNPVLAECNKMLEAAADYEAKHGGYFLTAESAGTVRNTPFSLHLVGRDLLDGFERDGGERRHCVDVRGRDVACPPMPPLPPPPPVRRR